MIFLTILQLQKQSNCISYLKYYLKRYLRHVYIFHSQESHQCYSNCLRLVGAITLPKSCNSPGSYDPEAQFRGNIHRTNASQPEISRVGSIDRDGQRAHLQGSLRFPLSFSSKLMIILFSSIRASSQASRFVRWRCQSPTSFAFL